MDVNDLKYKVESLVAGNKKQAMFLGVIAVVVAVAAIAHLVMHHG